MLLASKLGLTTSDLKRLSVASQRRNQDTIAQLRAGRSRKPIALKAMLAELAEKVPHATGGLQLLDLPIAPWTEIPPLGGFERQGKLTVTGLGDGWLTTKNTNSKVLGAWAFQIPTPLKGVYFVEAPIFAVGPYLVAADEGHCECKSALISVSATLQLFQNDVLIGSAFTAFTSKEVHDEIIQDLVLIGQNLQIQNMLLQGGLTTTAVASVGVIASADGAGSIAEVDFTKPGGVMSCPDLRIAGINF
jgi:hypothetical protein